MSPCVLVADDDAVTLALVALAVSTLGFEVTRAEDGDELLQCVAQRSFELVITDIAMPWMTGLQVTHSARTAGLETPIIVMTALYLDARHVYSLGASARLLRKPFTTKQLVAVIAQLMPRTDRWPPGES